MMVDRELGERYHEKNNAIGDVLFEVDNLASKGGFQNVSFKVKQGEILGVAGLMGAGRTEVMETIFDYRKKQSGSVNFSKINLTKKGKCSTCKRLHSL
ncbi:ATP-binding cassette domain-containing protein [Oceanobacillus senegalensis]|uniref:ATP-binding cassette domain-containing protein n=1 Tax=Oceanobacillus senegalensis TaxID=1936063 RepID=UPI003CCB756D